MTTTDDVLTTSEIGNAAMDVLGDLAEDLLTAGLSEFRDRLAFGVVALARVMDAQGVLPTDAVGEFVIPTFVVQRAWANRATLTS